MAMLAVHLLLLTRLGESSSYVTTLLPSLVIGGIGIALVMTPASAAAMKAVSVDKAGVGSAVLNAFRQVGGSVGIALMGAIVAAQAGASRTPEAFLDGLHSALLVAALIALGGAIVSAVFVRDERPASRRRDAVGAAGARGVVSKERGLTARRKARQGTRLPAAERRDAILQAALRVFCSGSYTGTTTAEIAREAGVTEPVIYRHFASKRALWLACMDEAWARFRVGAREEGRCPRRGARLDAFGQALDEMRRARVLLASLWMQGVTEALRGRRDPAPRAAAHARRARLRRRRDPPGAGMRPSSPMIATRTRRRGS